MRLRRPPPRLRFAFALALALALPVMPARAQEFVPFTITEQDFKQFRGWLDDQPMKFALPAAQWLDGLERRALADKAVADAKAKAQAAPPPAEK